MLQLHLLWFLFTDALWPWERMPSKDDRSAHLPAPVRVRGQNLKEEAILGMRLVDMECDMNRTLSRISRQISAISREMSSRSHTPWETKSAPTQSPAAFCTLPSISRAFSVPETPLPSRTSPRLPSPGQGPRGWARRRQRPAVNCVFQALPTGCRHFPCVQPQSYNSIGLEVNFTAENPEDRYHLSVNNAALCRQKLLEDLESHSVRRGKVNPADICTTREIRLRQSMERLRTKTMSMKPRDRSTRYGEPTPRRKIVKTARVKRGAGQMWFPNNYTIVFVPKVRTYMLQ